MIDISNVFQEVVIRILAQNTSTAILPTLNLFGFSFTLPKWILFKDDIQAVTARVISGASGGLIFPFVYIFIAVTVGSVIPNMLSILNPAPADGIFGDIVKMAISNNPIFTIIIWLILVVAICVTFFKVTWMLIKAFVNIVIQVVFSPFILLGEVLPGNPAFSNWIKEIISNLSLFPATVILFYLSFIFIGSIIDTNATSVSFMKFIITGEFNLFSINDPTYAQTLNNFSIPAPLGFPLLGNERSGKALLAIIGMGMFLMTPALAKMIADALKVKDLGYGSAIGDALKIGPNFVWDSGPVKAARETVSKEGGARLLNTAGYAASATGQIGLGTNLRTIAAKTAPSGAIPTPAKPTAPGQGDSLDDINT